MYFLFIYLIIYILKRVIFFINFTVILTLRNVNLTQNFNKDLSGPFLRIQNVFFTV